MLKEMPLTAVKLKDTFWQPYQELVKETVIPYQYQVLNDAIEVDVQAERKDDSLPVGKSHALENFRITAGLTAGEHFGWFFQDSDVYKWLEAVGYSLVTQPDPDLETIADEVIDLIGQAQAEDGYLDTFFQLKFPDLKYRMLHYSHELYCAGHLIEAAIAYTQGTGKTKLLEIAKKVVANIQAHFGYEEGKIQGADGHQEIELALARLYELTQDVQYLELAAFFTDVRGKDPLFYEKALAENLAEGLIDEVGKVDLRYLQALEQPKNQRTAHGHAVRMLYMSAGMAKIAHHRHDDELRVACEHIWEDITQRKMYLTGGVGSTVHGEAFTGAYDLPNDVMYCETCASIALVFFAYEMFKIEPKKEYLDVLERALYNGVLAGSSADGTHFFYVNPLEVQPDSCHHNPGKGHVKTTRPDWFGCACCPPNFALLIGSLQKYVYTAQGEDIYVNLFAASELTLADGFSLQQTTEFPYGDEVIIETRGGKKRLLIRKPAWATNLTQTTNARSEETAEYVIVWAEEDTTITLHFSQEVLAVRSNPKVWSNSNLLAIQRGPFVYCGEGIDNAGDLFAYRVSAAEIHAARVSVSAEITPQTLNLTLPATQITDWATETLYQFGTETDESQATTLSLIPYYLWGNRGENSMRVWFPKQ